MNKVDIQGFPTTWFLNREGWIAFLKRGWTKELEEKFGWRIEALRNELLAQSCILHLALRHQINNKFQFYDSGLL